MRLQDTASNALSGILITGSTSSCLCLVYVAPRNLIIFDELPSISLECPVRLRFTQKNPPHGAVGEGER